MIANQIVRRATLDAGMPDQLYEGTWMTSIDSDVHSQAFASRQSTSQPRPRMASVVA